MQGGEKSDNLRTSLVFLGILYPKMPEVSQRNMQTRGCQWAALTFALISIFNMDPTMVIRSLMITRTYHPLTNSHRSASHTCLLYFSRKKSRNL